MSNDISDVNKFLKSAGRSKINNSAEALSMPASGENISKPSEDMTGSMVNSMKFLNAMGHAQVNMNNPMTRGVKNSVDTFLNNTDYVQEHTEFCDELVKEGYPLEKAIDVTDKVFDTLKTEDTYNK